MVPLSPPRQHVAGQRGSIEATGDLTMQAGRDIGIVGSDVKAGGDATLSAGRNVIVAAQNLKSHNSMKAGSAKGHLNTQTSKAATVEAGGSVNISAGQGVTIQGSEVSAGANVNIGADRNIFVISDVEGYEYRFKQEFRRFLIKKADYSKQYSILAFEFL